MIQELTAREHTWYYCSTVAHYFVIRQNFEAARALLTGVDMVTNCFCVREQLDRIHDT